MNKRSPPPGDHIQISSSKRSKPELASSTPSALRQPLSLHSWLHPDTRPPLLTYSQPLHSSSSTFFSVSISFVAPCHVTSLDALTKEVSRVVRQLDVVGLVGKQLVESGEGAFGENIAGGGLARGSGGKNGKERAREPDHRMWAVRTLALKPGKNGTEGEGDYQKYGGERVLRILKDTQAVDVLTVCCRWYGGDMIGPIRFQHIGLTAQHSLNELLKLVKLRDLRDSLTELDKDIFSLRNTIARGEAQSVPPPSSEPSESTPGGRGVDYDTIYDVGRLERLVKAKEKTRESLQNRAGWAAFDQSRAKTEADARDEATA